MKLDISYKLLVFSSSYAVPIRTVTKPPYEVKESGWGEFDVEIKARLMYCLFKVYTQIRPGGHPSNRTVLPKIRLTGHFFGSPV